jgi:hypothetical protein
MRFIVFIIIVLLLAYAWWPEREPVPVEDTVIGQQIAPLRKAQKFEQQDYLEALDTHREQMDAQEEREGGR